MISTQSLKDFDDYNFSNLRICYFSKFSSCRF